MKPCRFTWLHPTVLGLPGINRKRADAHFARHLSGRLSCLQLGDTSRKGNLCTLRRAGGVSGVSERSEAAPGYTLIGVPGVIAGEIDVLPAKR